MSSRAAGRAAAEGAEAMVASADRAHAAKGAAGRGSRGTGRTGESAHREGPGQGGGGTAARPGDAAGAGPGGAAATGRPVAGRATSRDVARLAGVSQATVSLVLGEKWPGRVSERTVEAVRAAARDLGYRPNLAARSLRLGRTRTVLLVVPALTTEFFARVYTGAERVAADHGFGVVLYPSPEGVGPARDPFDSARASLDGVIASSMAAGALAAVRGGGLPLVMLDSDPDDVAAAATVNLDIADGARQAAGHLLALGHRRVAHLAAAVDSWTFQVRARALAEAMDEVPGTALGIEPAGLTVEEGRRAAERVLARPGPRPTALVCDDDILAAGACKAARRLGLRIPDDISVTGFDDLALATAVEPELTTVRLPAEAVGAAGMRALMTLMDGETPRDTVLPVELIPRGSTAPPPRS
ncbi:LacI family DNA-binding transcriptional regulator [Streptomyces antimycoticus]|uniref:LacI family DNA-binding transcriptional regulator n=3 Tax=Streptomyces TaxID=1883 RepID=A0ABD5JMH5_9ACTN|nr:LacI family DNA-binding transcriptional regulator [Streptomyces violaceusniger]MEE4588917.1 LacI family DNA-binding transcriptional regulator [Streptomyces sp. DSM 41602]